jgi:hypothetical protein
MCVRRRGRVPARSPVVMLWTAPRWHQSAIEVGAASDDSRSQGMQPATTVDIAKSTGSWRRCAWQRGFLSPAQAPLCSDVLSKLPPCLIGSGPQIIRPAIRGRTIVREAERSAPAGPDEVQARAYACLEPYPSYKASHFSGSANTHNVEPPSGFFMSGTSVDKERPSPDPLPVATATYCLPFTL